MRMTRLYTSQALALHASVVLTDSAHHHLAVVLRARLNATVALFNGDGNDYSAVINTITKKHTKLTVTGVAANTNESPLHSHLGQCISQNNRFDLAVQKATEMGVTQITPLISSHAQSLGKAQLLKRQDHWQQIAVNAAEQSHRTHVPRINAAIPLSQWLHERNEAVRWVCAIGGQPPQPTPSKANSLALLVGPEGGLSTDEVKSATVSGFSAIAMGNRVLRTETAPIAALSLAQYFWGDGQA